MYDRELLQRAANATAGEQHGATPGKQTLSEHEPPIQRKADPGAPEPAGLDPATVQADQYEPGTKLDRHNDCGPACLLMALRSIDPKLEDRLKRTIDSKHPEQVGLQAELDQIRALGGLATTSDALDMFTLRAVLAKVLGKLGTPVPKTEIEKLFPVEAEADRHGERAAIPRIELGGGAGERRLDAGGVDPTAELEAIIVDAHDLAAQVLKRGAGAILVPIRNRLADDARRVRALASSVSPELVTGANDAIVAVYQALSVSSADSTALAFQEADPKARDLIVKGIRSGSKGGADDDYCGEFVKAQYASAGLVADFASIFNHVDNVLAFFTYNAELPTTRVFDFIRAAGTTAWQAVHAYHAMRGSERTIHRTAEVRAAQAAGMLDHLMRPGDVVTMYLGGGDPKHADHTVMVRRAWADGFESIEGNAFVTLTGGTAAHGIGTNEWHRHGEDVVRDQPKSPGVATIYLVGRPSVVDFEAGNSYAHHAAT